MVAGFLFSLVLFRSVAMEFRNEERTTRLLCWMMDVCLLAMVGWLVGLVVVLIQQS